MIYNNDTPCLVLESLLEMQIVQEGIELTGMYLDQKQQDNFVARIALLEYQVLLEPMVEFSKEDDTFAVRGLANMNTVIFSDWVVWQKTQRIRQSTPTYADFWPKLNAPPNISTLC